MLGIAVLQSSTLFYILIFSLIVSSFWLAIYICRTAFVTRSHSNISFFPKLSVIIPVHNGERTIGNTLRALFSSNYPKRKMEVIVVNDASTDKTASVLKSFPVKIVKNMKQSGKVFSLNKGISRASGDIIVTMDDDSVVKRNTISLLVKPFEDADIGAVAGVYKTRSERRLIEKLQSFEYMWFSMTRRLQEALGCVLVIPGALGAFRKEVLAEIGGFDSDTMIEDYDITVKVHKAGYKVACVKDASAVINAPANIMGLVKQRTRWYRGGLQVFWKHRDVFAGRRGTLSFLWIFEGIGMALQLYVLGLLGMSGVRFIIANSFASFLIAIKIWFINLFTFNLTLIEAIPLFVAVLFGLGLVTAALSAKLTGESFRKLLLYPVTMFYAILLTGVFVKSLCEELLHTKRVWSLQHGKC